MTERGASGEHAAFGNRDRIRDSKDYEFSRLSMEDHWRAGYHDTVRTLRHPEVLERPDNHEGVMTFDLAQNGRVLKAVIAQRNTEAVPHSSRQGVSE